MESLLSAHELLFKDLKGFVLQRPVRFDPFSITSATLATLPGDAHRAARPRPKPQEPTETDRATLLSASPSTRPEAMRRSPFVCPVAGGLWNTEARPETLDVPHGWRPLPHTPRLPPRLRRSLGRKQKAGLLEAERMRHRSRGHAPEVEIEIKSHSRSRSRSRAARHRGSDACRPKAVCYPAMVHALRLGRRSHSGAHALIEPARGHAVLVEVQLIQTAAARGGGPWFNSRLVNAAIPRHD
jgi:hypothetical protein